jgi:hypothetical protein
MVLWSLYLNLQHCASLVLLRRITRLNAGAVPTGGLASGLRDSESHPLQAEPEAAGAACEAGASGPATASSGTRRSGGSTSHAGRSAGDELPLRQRKQSAVTPVAAEAAGR